MSSIFTADIPSSRELVYTPMAPIREPAAVISAQVPDSALALGDAFAEEIERNFFADFEKTAAMKAAGLTEDCDLMVHVSTFLFDRGTVYMTYYANTHDDQEDPEHQTARLAYCPVSDPSAMTFLDIQTVGEACSDGVVLKLYDTILMRLDEDRLMVLWTADISGNYYRLCRTFTLSTRTLGEITVNRFAVGDTVNDFSATGIRAALAENGLPCKTMYSDIGIMQKLSARVENGETWYYTGTYSGDFNAIIKSRDLVTWTYVAQPDFPNQSKWENAVYVIGDRVFYFVRQQDSEYGFLTRYDLVRKTWAAPVLISDCQSRSDFILWDNRLYLFHAPVDREHIGIVRVDPDQLENSRVILQAHMKSSCFYPFVQYDEQGRLWMSYTVNRKHIRLARFSFENYLRD